MDARFTLDKWIVLTQLEALNAVGMLVLRSPNQIVQWAEFFSVGQGEDECVSDCFIKGAQAANDCAFQCPQCSCNLS